MFVFPTFQGPYGLWQGLRRLRRSRNGRLLVGSSCKRGVLLFQRDYLLQYLGKFRKGNMIYLTKMYLIFMLTIMLIHPTIRAEGELYKLNLLPQDQGAACLDGSPPGFYLHEGFGQNKKNFLLYFSGGGFCGEPTLSQTLQSCYQRSSTGLGSTKNASPTLNTTGKGLLSTYEKQNRAFYDWTKIGVIYCDGSEWAGYRSAPISYKDKQLHFRGSRNVMTLFRELDRRYGLFDGGSIVITGVSAGGIASYQWSNYLVENTRKAKVYAMPDSGFFITDFYSAIVGKKMLREDAQVLLNLVYNKTQMPGPINSCLEEPGFDLVDCFNAANYAEHLKAPIFMIQSAYDSWSLKYILGAQCLSPGSAPFALDKCNEFNRTVIEDYRVKSIVDLKIIKDLRKDIGGWGPACSQHGFSTSQSYYSDKFKVNQTTLMEAIERFLKNPNEAEWLIDERKWPQNAGCSGLRGIGQLRQGILTE